MMRVQGGERGMSLIEVTIVLLAMSVLTGLAAPVARRSIDRARVSRALTDTTAIKTAVIAFLTDMPGATGGGTWLGFTQSGDAGGATVDTLVSDGDIPDCSTPAGGTASVYGCGAVAVSWNQVVNGTTTDFLEHHLVTNLPGNSVANDYPIPTGAIAAGWRGAYLTAPIDPDPWGNRYAVNVRWLTTASVCAGTRTNDTVVLSAGPDESISTRYRPDLNAAATATDCTAGTAGTGGIFVEGDDIMAVVRREGAATGTVP